MFEKYSVMSMRHQLAAQVNQLKYRLNIVYGIKSNMSVLECTSEPGPLMDGGEAVRQAEPYDEDVPLASLIGEA